MAILAQFLKIRAVEAGTMVATFAILFWFAKDVYWPSRPYDPVTIGAGAVWAVIMFFVVWGYIVTSALAFALAGALSGWRPIWIAMAGATAFGAHSLFLIRLFELKLDLLSWAVWGLFICLNAALPLLLMRAPEFRGH